MATKKKKAPAKTRVVYRPAKKAPVRRSGSRKARAKDFITELEPVLLAVGGAVLGSIVAKKLPVAKTPNGEKLKLAAVALGTAYASTKAKKAGIKSVLGGAAVGTGVSLVRALAPTLLAGDDDLLGYTLPLGSEEEARVYMGMNELENLSGEMYGDDDLLGEDLLGMNPTSSNSVNLY